MVLLMTATGIAGNCYERNRGSLPSIRPGHSFIPGQLMAMMVDGPAYYYNLNTASWQRIIANQTIKHGDAVRTTANGYLLLTWSADNMIMLKPHTSIHFAASNAVNAAVPITVHSGEIMVSCRNSDQIRIETKHGIVTPSHGETSVTVKNGEITLRAVRGMSRMLLSGNTAPSEIHESYSLNISADGKENPLTRFDPATEYYSFRRFDTWLSTFTNLHRMYSPEVPFKIDSVRINDRFITSLPRHENNFYIIETENGTIPDSIHLQLKVTPYPAPGDKLELYLGKDLTYALREGRDGYHEVIFTPPSIPEFLMAVHMIDSQQRKVNIFQAGFVVENRRIRSQKARQFCEEMADAMRKRDQIWFRRHVSRDYRDWQGNTWYDFFNMADDTMRRYRDIRLTLHPFRYEIREGETLVHLNYRISALTADWTYRYEDRGSEIFTLRQEDGLLKLYSKVAGLFFNRLRVAIDLRKGVLRGRIVDQRTRRPVSGVSVTVRGTSFHATTDSMGEYVIYNIPTGNYDIKFHRNGFGEVTATGVAIKPSGEQF